MRKKHQLPNPPPALKMSNKHQIPTPPPAPMMNKEYKGYNGTMVLTDSCVIIKRGAKGFMLGGGMLRGDKTIPYSSIVAVQMKKAKTTAGYLQLTLIGGSESKRGLMQSATDENSINFHSRKNKSFLEAKRLIEERITQSSIPQTTPSPTPPPPSQDSYLEELEKLAALRDKGIITEDDFNAKKSKLLGL